MTNKPTWGEMSLKEKILYRVDFLSDHWTKGDDKIPFQFGGWREEVAEDIIKIFFQEKDKALAEQKKELITELNYTGVGKQEFSESTEHWKGRKQGVEEMKSLIINLIKQD